MSFILTIFDTFLQHYCDGVQFSERAESSISGLARSMLYKVSRRHHWRANILTFLKTDTKAGRRRSVCRLTFGKISRILLQSAKYLIGCRGWWAALLQLWAEKFIICLWLWQRMSSQQRFPQGAQSQHMAALTPADFQTSNFYLMLPYIVRVLAERVFSQAVITIFFLKSL